jgi:hypothetical protein
LNRGTDKAVTAAGTQIGSKIGYYSSSNGAGNYGLLVGAAQPGNNFLNGNNESIQFQHKSQHQLST